MSRTKMTCYLSLCVCIHLIAGINSMQLMGGWSSPSSANDLNEIVNSDDMKGIKAKVKKDYQLTLSEILGVQTQVVSGINYRVRGMFKTDEGEEKECNFEAWSKSWENFLKINKFSCKDAE